MLAAVVGLGCLSYPTTRASAQSVIRADARTSAGGYWTGKPPSDPPDGGYWSGSPPGSTANPPQAVPNVQGAGCPSDITKGDGPWACFNSQYDLYNYRAYLRRGAWNSSTKSGWGDEKALNYHNLYQQPILDTIELSATRVDQAQNTRYRYTAYHYNTQHQVDQEVIVVVTHVKTDNASGTSPDSYAVGVYTAYCTDATGQGEPRCPDWVNSTL